MAGLVHNILEPRVLSFIVPIVAILVWGGISITKAMIRHRERIAMIERGVNPDNPPESRQHPESYE